MEGRNVMQHPTKNLGQLGPSPKIAKSGFSDAKFLKIWAPKQKDSVAIMLKN